MTLWPRQLDLRQLHRRSSPIRAGTGGYINSLTYVVINTVMSICARAAGGLRLLALPLPRRQAPVLLAADQPHGAAGGLRAAVLQALFGHRPVRHAMGGGAGPLPVQRAAGGVDPRRLHVGRAAGDRRDGLHRRLFLPALLREDLHAADRQRHRRRGLLLLHVLLGRAAAGAHADHGRTPSRSPPP